MNTCICFVKYFIEFSTQFLLQKRISELLPSPSSYAYVMHFLGLVMPASPLPNLETSPVLLSASDISIFIMLKRILLWKHEHWYPSSMIAISKIRGVLISIKGKGVAVKNIAIISAGLAVLTLVLLLPTKVSVCIYLIRITLPKTMQRFWNMKDTKGTDKYYTDILSSYTSR